MSFLNIGQSFLAAADNATAHPHKFRVVPVTKENAEQLAECIRQQGRAHSVSEQEINKSISADSLLNSLQNGFYEAFLVVADFEENGAVVESRYVGGVTYYKSVASRGVALGGSANGVYLEDIVVLRNAGLQGVGDFAMAALAKISLGLGASTLTWSVAASNEKGHKLYKRVNSEHLGDDRTIYRRQPYLKHKLIGKSAIVCRAATTEDLPAINKLLGNQSPTVRPDDLSDDNIVTLVAVDANNNITGVTRAYRNFSTFRNEPGLHIEQMVIQNNDMEIFSRLMGELSGIQEEKGWTGHTDFILTSDQTEAYKSALEEEKRGFKVEKYPEDTGPPMVARRLHGAALIDLASKVDDDVVNPLSLMSADKSNRWPRNWWRLNQFLSQP
jgi:hypothetical protein